MSELHHHVSAVGLESHSFIESKRVLVEFPHIQLQPFKTACFCVFAYERDHFSRNTHTPEGFVNAEFVYIQIIALIHKWVFRTGDVVKHGKRAYDAFLVINDYPLKRIVEYLIDMVAQLIGEAGLEYLGLALNVQFVHLPAKLVDPLKVFMFCKTYRHLNRLLSFFMIIALSVPYFNIKIMIGI